MKTIEHWSDLLWQMFPIKYSVLQMMFSGANGAALIMVPTVLQEIIDCSTDFKNIPCSIPYLLLL